MVQQAGASIDLVNASSNFQVVQVWVAEVKTFSAVSKFSVYQKSKGDIQAIWNMQTALNDGYTLAQHMSPLVYTGKGVNVMWTNGGGAWDTSQEYQAGTMVYGGQMFAASTITESIFLKLPAESSFQYVDCRKVLPFRRSDFGKSFDQYPWLINKHTVVYSGNKYSEIFKGCERRVPLPILDPRDFKFMGTDIPSAFYIPSAWCIPV